MATSFSGEGSQSTWREPPTMSMQFVIIIRKVWRYTKWIIKSRKSKNRQCNGFKKKDKKKFKQWSTWHYTENLGWTRMLRKDTWRYIYSIYRCCWNVDSYILMESSQWEYWNHVFCCEVRSELLLTINFQVMAKVWGRPTKLAVYVVSFISNSTG